MAYTTLSGLKELFNTTVQDTDYILITSGIASYKIRVDNLKEFINLGFASEEWVIENKTISSISNTIYANAIQQKVFAEEDLSRGDIVSLVPISSIVPHVQKADNTTSSAIGIIKESALAGEETVIITSGTFTDIDLSGFDDGEILYTGETGNLISDKPVSGHTQQQVAIVLYNGSSNGVLLVLFGPPLQHSEDVTYNPTDSTGLTSLSVKTAIDELFQRCDREIVNTGRILISGNSIPLTQAIHGESIFGIAHIWDDAITNVMDEYTCEPGLLFDEFVFEEEDDLNGKYASVTYLGVKIKV